MGGIIFPTSLRPLDVRFRLLQICAKLADEQPDILKTVVFDSNEQLADAGNPMSGVALADCHLTPNDLPALAGITVGAAPERTGANRNRKVTCDYQFLVLFYQLCNESMEEQVAALTALWSRMDELPDYFASGAVDRLKHNDSGLRGIESVGHMARPGTGEDITAWLGATYSSTIYTLPVTTSRGGI
jgi:hypothetical protein